MVGNFVLIEQYKHTNFQSTVPVHMTRLNAKFYTHEIKPSVPLCRILSSQKLRTVWYSVCTVHVLTYWGWLHTRRWFPKEVKINGVSIVGTKPSASVLVCATVYCIRNITLYTVAEELHKF